MEKRILFFASYLFWFINIMQLTMVLSEANLTTSLTQIEKESVVGLYAWSAWGSWSPCSRSCGGGVSVQERQCLPRSRNLAVNGTVSSPSVSVRVTRQAATDCLGVPKRYQECNIHACPGGDRDVRAEQCSSYDRRPFRGRYYTWVPYIDGDAPCTLNCRPLGQQFYATLAAAADGASCTRAGRRALCVRGTCKKQEKMTPLSAIFIIFVIIVVGRDVLAVAGARDVRCGRRLVAGLFARPRLPLGYSYITTVPAGACRLNVSEIVASDNYIALKITNGSYIMNGEFAVSTPGTYEAAGARFVYTREAGLDSVSSLGPTHYDIDIMILYTQPNPSIKYEYFTESLPSEVESVTKTNLPEITIPPKHTRRHHGFDSHLQHKRPESAGLTKDISNESSLENVIGGRTFVWKILSYTQCSRSCGGGIQVGKYRCVEQASTGDREISSVHCAGAPPAGRRRRCGAVPCAPRWRAAAWSPCPPCGPAPRTRVVGCVQDHSRGITKISDLKCPAPKPPTTEPCNIPECTPRRGEVPKPAIVTDAFRAGPVYSVAVNASDGIGPEYSFSSVGNWLYTDWSECVGWCVGGGLQTRAVRCADPAGCAHPSPELTRTCTPAVSCEPHVGQWFTGEWSPCSAACGGVQLRGVLCVGGSGRHLRDAACRAPRPTARRPCSASACALWHRGDWGPCTGNCTTGGVQRRTVICARDGEHDCDGPAPPSARACDACAAAPVPPGLTIESQKSATEPPTTTARSTTSIEDNDCEDKLPNCSLAVQARLCHYKYYIQNCCDSCKV